MKLLETPGFCYECLQTLRVVEVGEDYYHDYHGLTLCLACLKRAISLFDETPWVELREPNE